MGSLEMIGAVEWDHYTSKSAATIYSPRRVAAGLQSRKTTTCHRWKRFHSYARYKDLWTLRSRLLSGAGVNGWRWKTGWLDLVPRTFFKIHPLKIPDLAVLEAEPVLMIFFGSHTILCDMYSFPTIPFLYVSGA